MKKILNTKKFKFSILIITLLFLYIFINAYFYVKQFSYDLQENVLRLHVIANSNSKEDQDLHEFYM